MSHTTQLGNGWVAIHDGDLRYSCDIIFRKESKEFEIPFEILEKLVAKAVTDRQINRLEDMSASEILYK